jgi:hypothetical protein
MVKVLLQNKTGKSSQQLFNHVIHKLFLFQFRQARIDFGFGKPHPAHYNALDGPGFADVLKRIAID